MSEKTGTSLRYYGAKVGQDICLVLLEGFLSCACNVIVVAPLKFDLQPYILAFVVLSMLHPATSTPHFTQTCSFDIDAEVDKEELRQALKELLDKVPLPKNHIILLLKHYLYLLPDEL
ncbi:hypothetical protein EON64_12625 [archaeon]|nr:MAG: hypothetical protein EON64_12625 [archaeon]